MAEKKSLPVTSFEVYRWPEFKAFCQRLGIAYELPTLRMSITIDMDKSVEVVHEYIGRDNGQPERLL